MKFFSVLAITALAATVSAQLEALPACANSCLSTPVADCTAFNIVCACKAQATKCSNGDAVTACVKKACPDEKDQAKAAGAFVGLCKSSAGGGVDISQCIPQPGGGSSGGGSSSGGSGGSSGGSGGSSGGSGGSSGGSGGGSGSTPPPPAGGCIPRYARRSF